MTATTFSEVYVRGGIFYCSSVQEPAAGEFCAD
jgi:hypothetical protein